MRDCELTVHIKKVPFGGEGAEYRNYLHVTKIETKENKLVIYQKYEDGQYRVRELELDEVIECKF